MPWHLEREEAFESSIRFLSKRFPSAAQDILGEFTSGPPASAVPLPKYERKLWKARAPSSDLRRGKSGGLRVIYYWDEELPNWCLLGTSYFKGDREDLTASELDRLFVSFKGKLDRIKKAMEEAEAQARPLIERPDE